MLKKDTAIYDVAVVGAGPAGASAARECAKAGLRTLLVDESVFPRYKLCGGGLTEAARKALGFKLDSDVIEQEVSRFRFCYMGKEFEADGKEYAVTTVLRDKFDKFLVEKAVEEGTEFVDGVRISNVNNSGGIFTLIGGARRFFARTVIGADGVNSVISKLVRQPFKKDELALCVGVEVHKNGGGMMEPDLIEVEIGVNKFSYGWVFPKQHFFSVGYGAYLGYSDGLRNTLLDYLKRKGAKGEFNIRGHLLPIGGLARKTYSNNVILVGDAAGYVDPFQGEGMRYAITSGRIAGKVLADAFSNNDITTNGLSAYEIECYNEFGRDLKWARRLAYLTYNLFKVVYPVVESNNEIFEGYLQVLSGVKSYKEFFINTALRAPFFLMKTTLKRSNK